MPAPVQVRFVAAAMLGIALLLLVLNFAEQRGGITPFGPELGADYPAFYIAGRILNSTPERLHDVALQEKLYRQLIPNVPANEFLVYPMRTVSGNHLPTAGIVALFVVLLGLAGDRRRSVAGGFLADVEGGNRAGTGSFSALRGLKNVPVPFRPMGRRAATG